MIMIVRLTIKDLCPQNGSDWCRQNHSVSSIEKNRLRYTEYYGDGDTKAFSAVESILWK